MSSESVPVDFPAVQRPPHAQVSARLSPVPRPFVVHGAANSGKMRRRESDGRTLGRSSVGLQRDAG